MTRSHKAEESSPTSACGQAQQNTIEAEASVAMRELVDLFKNLEPSKGSGRQYQLERINGELVFRQTEIDAMLEAAIDEAFDNRPKESFRRRVIKLP